MRSVALATVTISIHAPSRERRFFRRSRVESPGNFNPRSLAGATLSQGHLQIMPAISIHAPSRERLQSSMARRLLLLFQSTLPRGSDPHRHAYHVSKAVFQSTLPRGSDIPPSRYTEPFSTFQSTLPRGSDLSHHDKLYRFRHFNPRSLAGATHRLH